MSTIPAKGDVTDPSGVLPAFQGNQVQKDAVSDVWGGVDGLGGF